ncbi:hypothetical protein ACXYMU_12115 [Pontibacter sp. CAU 1760]
MKNKLILPLLSALALAASPLRAQELPTPKPQAVAPYKFSAGLRVSMFGPSGTLPELRLKYFVKPEAALELQVGKVGFRESYQASLHYLWQPQLLTSNRLRPYAGLGLGLTGTTRDVHYEEQPLQTNLVGIATIGLEYTFPKAPIALSLDYRHTFAGYKTDQFKDVPLRRMNNIGLSVKYLIR